MCTLRRHIGFAGTRLPQLASGAVGRNRTIHSYDEWAATSHSRRQRAGQSENVEDDASALRGLQWWP